MKTIDQKFFRVAAELIPTQFVGGAIVGLEERTALVARVAEALGEAYRSALKPPKWFEQPEGVDLRNVLGRTIPEDGPTKEQLIAERREALAGPGASLETERLVLRERARGLELDLDAARKRVDALELELRRTSDLLVSEHERAELAEDVCRAFEELLTPDRDLAISTLGDTRVDDVVKRLARSAGVDRVLRGLCRSLAETVTP